VRRSDSSLKILNNEEIYNSDSLSNIIRMTEPRRGWGGIYLVHTREMHKNVSRKIDKYFWHMTGTIKRLL
jgi:hypothetical protein